jgi:hypothetical protein
MSTVPLPLPQYYPRQQEDLFWYRFEADGALGRKSNQGAIEARLEGASGSYGQIDLESKGGLYMALQEVTNRASFRAAGKLRRIEQAYRALQDPNGWRWPHTNCSPSMILSAVYWTPPQQGMEAFEAFANVVVFSKTAHEKYQSKKTKMTFVEWVMLLSQRRLGFYDQKTKQRGKPKATNGEIAICILILHECKILLRDALWLYVKSERRVRHGT